MTALHSLYQVDNDQSKDDMPYEEEPQCDFQRFLRLPKKGREEVPNVYWTHKYIIQVNNL